LADGDLDNKKKYLESHLLV